LTFSRRITTRLHLEPLALEMPTSLQHRDAMRSTRRLSAGLVALAVVVALTIGMVAPPQQPADEYEVTIARVKYGGGGDWYVGPESLPQLLQFVRENTLIDVAPREATVELSSDNLYRFPFLFLTGHGNVEFSDSEARALRRYLDNGGFLHIDDCYGLDPFIRREMQKVFPEQEFVELPLSHPIYHVHYGFPEGLPKVHEHDGKPPQGFGLFDEMGRLVVFYTYETDLHDGWEPPSVHNNPPDIRRAAKQMGTNILLYVLTRPSAPNPNAIPAQVVTSVPRAATSS
jgi:hypothetical protein